MRKITLIEVDKGEGKVIVKFSGRILGFKNEGGKDTEVYIGTGDENFHDSGERYWVPMSCVFVPDNPPQPGEKE